MKVFEFYKSKKYLQRVLFSIMMSMVLVLLALSTANTYILERSVKNNQEESNLKVLSQIQYNLSYMNEIITNLSNSIYNDNLLVPLMYDDPLPKMSLIRGYQRFSSMMRSSSFLHSIVVYNYKQNELFGSTTSFLLDEGVTKSKIRDWLFDPDHELPKFRLIPVSLEAKDGQIDAFAFIVTNYLKTFSRSESAIILYIKSDWVFESLKNMDVAHREQGEIFIADQEGKMYASHSNKSYSNEEDHTQIKQLINKDKRTTKEKSGFVIGDISGETSMITYMDDNIGNWTIMYIQSYDKLMEKVWQTRVTSFILSGIFVIISIGLSIWLSYKLYYPIENMLKRMRIQSPRGGQIGRAAGDELHLLSDNYMRLSEKLQNISSEQIVNKYYIRKFLTDSQMFSHNDLLRLIEQHDLNISVNHQILVCVLRIDDYMMYDRSHTGEAKKLHRFAIVNIGHEMMSREYPCEAVEVRGDHVVLIISRSDSDVEALFEQVIPLIREIQETIQRFYGLSLSCGISDKITQFPYISTAYNQALHLSLYKMIKGNQSIITTDEVKVNLSNKQVSIPDMSTKKLAEALKKGQMTEAGGELEMMFSLLATFYYDDMIREASNLAWLIKNTAMEIMNNRIVQFAVDIDNIHHIPQEKETLEEMYITLLSLCAQICEGQRPANMERNEMILETIKELIEQTYADLNLSQQSIASNVKLSSAYIGKLFKDSYHISITEYINDVRLRHVQTLLENKDYSVQEIMEKCGYSNPSYFFRLFKAKYGSTPKEYRMKKSLF